MNSPFPINIHDEIHAARSHLNSLTTLIEAAEALNHDGLTQSLADIRNGIDVALSSILRHVNNRVDSDLREAQETAAALGRAVLGGTDADVDENQGGEEQEEAIVPASAPTVEPAGHVLLQEGEIRIGDILVPVASAEQEDTWDRVEISDTFLWGHRTDARGATPGGIYRVWRAEANNT